MTHLLTSGAYILRRVFEQKRLYFEHLGLIQMFVYIFAIRKKSSDFF